MKDRRKSKGGKLPIRLEVVNDDEQHFCVYFDRPGRIEITRTGKTHGSTVAFVYEGTQDDQEQEPLGHYDGTMNPQNVKERNRSWRR